MAMQSRGGIDCQFQSLLEFLIERQIVDNCSESETLSKFIELYEGFEDQIEDPADSNEDSMIAFETRTIFTLADFMKSLSANEYYDIAQRLYNQWSEHQQTSGARQKPYPKLQALVRIYEKKNRAKIQKAFSQWKQMNQFVELIDENEKLRQYIQMLVQENENLQSDRNILELQTKKRNQFGLNNIAPLRSRRSSYVGPAPNSQRNGGGLVTHRSSSRGGHSSHNQQFQEHNSVPIHERLHREAYKKNQQKTVNDVLKQRGELRDCTFKPLLSAKSQTPLSVSRQREDPLLYERLSKSNRKINPDILILRRENEELKACTFKPATNKKSKEIAELQVDYNDKERFYERLHKEGENKEQYMRSLQILKEHSEVNQCTFHPETNTSQKDSQMSASKLARQSFSNDSETFKRLHSDHEKKQRNKMKIESEFDSKFKEQHPFQPTRIAKSKDVRLCGDRQENSQQRSERMYEAWRERERKIEDKRRELQKEEEKLYRLTCKQKPNKSSVDQNLSQSNINSYGSQMSPGQSQMQTAANTQTHLDKLYAHGKSKSKRQDDMREKLFKEQGFNFVPHTNKGKYECLFENNNVIDRNKEFLQKKEEHLREIEQQTACDFKPQLVATQSKLSRQYNYYIKNENDENWGDKLYAQAQEMEWKKEKQRQEQSIDRNCTFKPQLAKGSEKILRESRASNTKSTISMSSYSNNMNTITVPSESGRVPLTNRTNNFN